MKTEEFRDQFELLYNNITSNQAPGLDDYEKSVFLTRAQDDLIRAYFHPRGNKHFEGFDQNNQRPFEFAEITDIKEFTPEEDDASFSKEEKAKGIYKIKIDSDIYAIVNETALVERGDEKTILIGKQISNLEYDRLMSKPFKRPLKREFWRIMGNKSDGSYNSEIVLGPTDKLTKYQIRYIRKPRPIILDNIAPQTIEGVDNVSECELNECLHDEILQRAVELAKAAYTSDQQLQQMIYVGQASQTGKGLPIGGQQ